MLADLSFRTVFHSVLPVAASRHTTMSSAKGRYQSTRARWATGLAECLAAKAMISASVANLGAAGA